MFEGVDPYFEHRIEVAKGHKVLRTIEIQFDSREVEPNKEIPNLFLEGTVESLAWSERVVENIIDAFEKGWIDIHYSGEDDVKIEFLPIPADTLPEEFGHISEIENITKNLKKDIFGSEDSDELTYLQTTKFAVEGYIDDETNGKVYGRVFINPLKLLEKRNVYLDPESIELTDYEYGHSFCVRGVFLPRRLKG